MRWWLGAALLVVLLGLGATAAVIHRGLQARSSVALTFDLPRGQAFAITARQLEEQGVVRDAWLLQLLARYRVVDRRIPAGRYRFAAGMSVVEVLNSLEMGEILRVRRTVPEGLALGAVADRLFPDDSHERERFLALARDPAAFSIPVPAHGNLEGYLFPDTYTLDDPPTARAALQAMLANGAAQTDSLRSLAAALQLSWDQVLTLASIVEGEARVAEERPRIAGVYHNRLRKGMLLQADPTVAYAVDKVGESLTFADLEIDSPYNTYRHAGLPPGPINSPGLAAIRATLHPADHTFYYFVHQGDGRHAFSRTLAEHQRAVSEARRRRSRR